MQTVCKFTHCLPQTLLGMLGRQEVIVATNIISVPVFSSQFPICQGSFQKEDLGKQGSATQDVVIRRSRETWKWDFLDKNRVRHKDSDKG